jgi:acyl-CoA thioester hydrolase
MTEYAFSFEMEVRDYECDMQGIVNNAVYQNYLEHARHKFLKHLGLDFAAYAREGINLVVIRAEVDYKASLTSGDKFAVRCNFVRESNVKFAFYQDIYRLSDEKLSIKAKIIGTAINAKGRPEIPEEMKSLMKE